MDIDLKKMEKELKKKMQPKMILVPVSYCYVSTTRLSYSEQHNYSSLIKEITIAFGSEAIDTEMAKKFFGASAEIVCDYKINKEFLHAHRNDPKMKYIKYDSNLLNDSDRMLIQMYPWNYNMFTLNPKFMYKEGDQ